ncbi:Tol-Pal system beta propeller repeat protein TolB [Ideonella sp.]|uniref:Tol-Pal system beta propeller repeat protein TolB n=1 Tax=Ideonella sp. TaxID=1929293 RepID=UPI002B4928E6|nr:Tol-Pal system beta propeller repeat protein TolB [Ideonella sp.]HJV68592.1 Tol-Pal system beta propeller repeat protein TolB [Ideonella sp.]
MGALGALGTAAALPAQAEFRVEISGIGATQLPITLLPFRDESLGGSNAISAIVRADLERSGAFRFIDAPLRIDETGAPGFPDLRSRGSDALAAGSVTKLADGRFDVRYKLWDVVKGADQGGQSLAVPAADLRLAAHRIADAIYEKLTGEKGVFATRIAYVTKGGGHFTLRVTDADGEGGQVPLTSPDPIISPAWSPDGRELAYVSFEDRKPVVWVQNLQTGARRRVANFKGSNSAPAWSPDGRDLAVTLSREGGSQIFLIGRDGANPRRVTQSSAIDTEPVFSPDGKSLYFVSDRGGSPQIYRQPVAGGGAERVTFQGSYNVSPAISPDGRMMAFVQRNGGFKVATMDLASGAVQVLSDTSDDESPSFSPNGRFIIYATRAQGHELLMTTTLDGKIKTKLLTSGLDIREPVWGPYGR